MELIPYAYQHLYKAKSMKDGNEVVGALICCPPFSYICTIESMKKMCVDELNDGEVKNLKLTRVLERSIEEFR
jgi:hypothetical protein